MSVIDESIGFLTTTQSGMMVLALIMAVLAILLVNRLTALVDRLLRPSVEHAFYYRILNIWLGPFFARHKIIATFIKLQGLGETVVDAIMCLIGTFFVVALLSSCLTAMLIHIAQTSFVYSPYLLILTALAALWGWILIRNLRYLYRLSHRLK